MPVIEDDTPKRSSEIKAAIRGFERLVSEAAERHDKFDYNRSLSSLNAAKAELAGAEARERREAEDARARAKFREQTGYDDIGQMFADRFRTGHSAHASRVLNADRAEQIAEAMLKPKPSDADKAATALAQVRAQSAAIRDGARSALEQYTTDTDLEGDAA